MSKQEYLQMALLIKRQRALTRSALILSELENIRGKSHRVIDIIAPYSESDAVYLYRLELDDTYTLVSGWFREGMGDCLSANTPIPAGRFSAELFGRMMTGRALGLKDMRSRGGCLLPVLESENVRSALVYSLVGLDNVLGILVYVSHHSRGWGVLCREWLDSISAMLTGAIRRTISTETLARELMLRDKIYPIIGHDLRSSMGAVKMMIEVLNHQQISDQDREYLKLMVERGADEAFMMLDNLLKWSRGAMGRVVASKANIDMGELIRGVAYSLSPTAAAKGITIETKIGEEVGDFLCDAEMIKTIVRNLLSNAVKFSYNGSVVTVDSFGDSSGIYIGVEDRGVGMSASDIARLNDDKEHFTSYGTANEAGSGLGYVLCRQFALLHGGGITVDSTPSRGSRFTLYLPYPVA